ncbi:YceI family protein [Corallococcus sp. ZKHCc1 1396]|uniref:YceI family protein n=1 Tax=Corallococcus soli TaxID=2710757 RepID=A0ABR9PP93_9BACT|nr:YceI family protein [Corallococcus soli]MBE4749734.1 YceI family protein [Corallococcus soli]
MKMTLKSAITLIAVAAPSFAFAAAYDIDGSHSSADFSVKHMMVSNVKGNFKVQSGTVNIDDKDVTKSTVEAVLDAASINTSEPKRDEHLKSPDFFDTAKFPTITFKSTKVAKAGKDKLKVTGDLTLHGVTKPVVLDVVGPTPEIKDAFGGMRRGVEATTKINRKDFGLGWNKALEAGGVAVGEDISIVLALELTPKKDAAAAPAAKDTK